jgi:pimeloyl-ACP methyl ester carboxylesterase
MRSVTLFGLVALALFEGSCSRAPAERSSAPALSSTSSAHKSEGSAAEGPLHVATLDEAENPPIYVLRGGSRGPDKLVFLHGMCGHGLGYAQSFQNSAARRGTLVVPQGDVPCDTGRSARWSADIEALDTRIVRAFRTLGLAEPIDDIIIIGYSQGATRAEWLVRRFPDRYTRLVLMGGPYAAKVDGLQKLRGAVALAGDRDRLDLMQASARALKAAEVPATFMLIPDAIHGSMGREPEATMDRVFAWLSENQRGAPP